MPRVSFIDSIREMALLRQRLEVLEERRTQALTSAHKSYGYPSNADFITALQGLRGDNGTNDAPKKPKAKKKHKIHHKTKQAALAELAKGTPPPQVAKRFGISEASAYVWKRGLTKKP